MKKAFVKAHKRLGKVVKSHYKNVKSSHISSVKYDEDLQDLKIRFKKGGTYLYADVPQKVVEGLLAAPSKGKYFHAKIRKTYNYTKQ